jgi:phosphoglucosamine mutase
LQLHPNRERVDDVTRLFGTDGVRGVANIDLTPELAFALGRAFAQEHARQQPTRPHVVVGRDTRQSGDLLEAALCAGLMSEGADVWRIGVIPTPGVAYLARTTGAAAGVMISASHNPMEDNGIKFFGRDGFKLRDDVEDAIEARLDHLSDGARLSGRSIGCASDRPDLRAAYQEFLCTTVRHRFTGLRVAVDAANGAASEFAAPVLERLGASVAPFHCAPDGANINVGCGSTHPAEIARLTIEARADVGLSFDGDADRLIAVDERGGIVDGDRTLLICGRALLSAGELRGHTIVATVMSNYGFIKAAREMGVELVRTSVGDRYVMEAMREGGYILGGEQSGHVIFLRHNTTGDGLLTALQLLDAMIESGQPLSQLAAVMRSYPQVLMNVRVRDKTAWRADDAVAQAIAAVEDVLGEDGRVLVRESGTEPIVRVMVEGPDEARVAQLCAEIAGVLQVRLGA